MENPSEADHNAPDVESLLEKIRTILLTQDRERLRVLEAQLQELKSEAHQGDEALAETIKSAVEEIKKLEQVTQEQAESDLALQNQVTELQSETQPPVVAERLRPEMTNLIRRTIHESHDEMAEAIGPVMGEAIRVQIRDSRKDMVEALYPIIGDTVQRAIGEFAREFQRNIDARLQATFGAQGFLRRMWARLRGVSQAELAMRDALPFSIQEIFLIQHGSGLLLAHSSPEVPEALDSDLVGAMLTAIRDFAHDSFGEEGNKEQELDEINYGDLHILVQSGKYAYLAVVYTGIEPEGFRATLRAFVTELHVRFANALRDYDGDPAILPNLPPQLDQLASDTTPGQAPREMSRGQRWLLIGGVVGGVVLLTLACFYLRFTLALLPVAFPGPSATPTNTATTTPTYTATATRTPTLTASPTLTPTPSPTDTPTSTPTQTPTLTPSLTWTPKPSPTPTQESIAARTLGDIWVRTAPDTNANRLGAYPGGTPLQVFGLYGNWAKIQWLTPGGVQEGWVSSRWLSIPDGVPDWMVTPTVTVEPASP
jgi:hypothetical protein